MRKSKKPLTMKAKVKDIIERLERIEEYNSARFNWNHKLKPMEKKTEKHVKKKIDPPLGNKKYTLSAEKDLKKNSTVNKPEDVIINA